MGYPPMGDSAICLPWDKTENSIQRVMAGGITKIHKRVQRYSSKFLPPGTDTERSWGTLIKCNNTMEPFLLPKQRLLLPVGEV